MQNSKLKCIVLVPIAIGMMVLLIGSCGQTVKKERQQEKGTIESKTINIEIDGVLNDWPETPFLTSLVAPWEQGMSDSTFFNSYASDAYFFFYFSTVDTTLTTVPFKEELSLIQGDRVELFFAATEDLSKDYYCIEISPDGDILDYKATFYRKFEEAWNFKTVELVAFKTNNGYLVEGKIALEELKSLGIHNAFYLGIFKADFKNKEDVTWYSWVKPDTKEPDFHIASAFKRFSMKSND